MTRDEIVAWATASGWQMIAGHASLTKPGGKDPIVRLVLKATVATLEVRKPAGKWEKMASAPYAAIAPASDPEDVPAGLGFEQVPTIRMLMQRNRDAMVFARMG